MESTSWGAYMRLNNLYFKIATQMNLYATSVRKHLSSKVIHQIIESLIQHP